MLQVFLYSRLPLNAASRLWGKVNNLELPTWARKPVLGTYAWLFNCNTSEMAVSDLTQYRNLGEFFRRGLKPGCRPVDVRCSLVSFC
jgi:phosphatidylserine decarboxylase